MPDFNVTREGLPQIDRMSHRHDAILRWMLANPDKKLLECAEALGYTQTWLSMVVHSDIFQAKYRELSADFDSVAIMDLRDKLTGIAHAAVDKLSLQMEGVTDVGTLLKISDSTLTKLGYGSPKASPVVVNNQFNQTINGTVSKEVLLAARAMREKMLTSPTPTDSLPPELLNCDTIIGEIIEEALNESPE